MFKKALSVLLAVCLFGCCLLPAAAAQNDVGVIRVRLNSDIAGLTESDAESLFELLSDNVVYTTLPCGPVSISDYSGTHAPGEVKAGRTYYIDYYMDAANGLSLPETLEDKDVEIECGKGVTVISGQIVTSHIRNNDGSFSDRKAIKLTAKVVVDGSIPQRIVGWICDLILKIRAWSLY